MKIFKTNLATAILINIIIFIAAFYYPPLFLLFFINVILIMIPIIKSYIDNKDLFNTSTKINHPSKKTSTPPQKPNNNPTTKTTHQLNTKSQAEVKETVEKIVAFTFANHFAIRRFNIEFDLSEDFFVDIDKINLMLQSNNDNIISIISSRNNLERIIFAKYLPTTEESLIEDKSPDWLGEAVKLKNCIYRKASSGDMIHYSVVFNYCAYVLSHENYTMSQNKKCENEILTILKSLEKPQYVKLNNIDTKFISDYITAYELNKTNTHLYYSLKHAFFSDSVTKTLLKQLRKILPSKKRLSQNENYSQNELDDINTLFEIIDSHTKK